MDGGGGEAPNPRRSALPVRLFGDETNSTTPGYHTVTPEQITAWREGVLDLPHDALLLTFDDGRADTVSKCVARILKRVARRQAPSRLVARGKRSPLYQASPDGLCLLQRQGWSIEAHAPALSQA